MDDITALKARIRELESEVERVRKLGKPYREFLALLAFHSGSRLTVPNGTRARVQNEFPTYEIVLGEDARTGEETCTVTFQS